MKHVALSRSVPGHWLSWAALATLAMLGAPRAQADDFQVGLGEAGTGQQRKQQQAEAQKKREAERAAKHEQKKEHEKAAEHHEERRHAR